MQEKDVIVVTLNYRVGVFGFLASDDASVDANAGILDQRMALEWIKRNIHAFGGDKERITVFGMSAGATSIAVHLTSPTTPPGLFKRAIHQSGPLGIRMRRMEDTIHASMDVARRLKCIRYVQKGISAQDEEVMDMQCMRTRKSKEILKALKDPMNNQTAHFQHPDPKHRQALDNNVAHEMGDMFYWWPTLDGKHIVDQPYESLKQGKLAIPNIDLIMGVQRDEGGYYTVDYDSPVIGTWKSNKIHNSTSHTKHVQQLFGQDYFRLAQYYPEHPDTEGNLLEIANLVGDFVFICPTQSAADGLSHSSAVKRLWMYEWTQPGFVSLSFQFVP